MEKGRNREGERSGVDKGRGGRQEERVYLGVENYFQL